MWRKLLDKVKTLAHAFLDLTGFMAIRQTGCKLSAENLLEDCGAGADTDARAEAPEQIGARNDNGGVFDGSVSKEADESRGYAWEDSQLWGLVDRDP